MIERAGDQLAPLVDALVRGGDATALLRAIAASIKGAYRAALQIVDAALLLDPDRVGCYVTRSLVNVHLGAPDSAARDVQRLPADWGEQRAQLEGYVRAIFPAFDFWPARGRRRDDLRGVSRHARRSRWSRCAPWSRSTRRALRLLRQTLSQRLREAGADAGAAARAGCRRISRRCCPTVRSRSRPRASSRASFPTASRRIEAPTCGRGVAARCRSRPSRSTSGSRSTNASVPALQRLARGDWAALCWLCWSCGLDRVALPDALEPPADFGPAAGMSIERTWRCRDKLTSGGLVAMTRGVPGFEWEGMAIDDMPRVLAEVMTEEYLEVRAMFLWLCDETARSPWQSDLRDGGLTVRKPAGGSVLRT